MAGIQQALFMKAIAAAGYSTWNPSDKNSNVTLSGGDLTITYSTTGQGAVRSTLSKSSGKYYWEYVKTAGSATTIFGVGNGSASLTGSQTGTNTACYTSTGALYVNGAFNSSATGINNGDVVGVAIDLTAKSVSFYLNNSLQGSVTYTFANPTFAWVSTNDNSTGNSITANFGATTLTYTPPVGYTAGLI